MLCEIKGLYEKDEAYLQLDEDLHLVLMKALGIALQYDSNECATDSIEDYIQ